MTEDEAKKTRCCGPEGCGAKSSYDNKRFCIASACMAWRWTVCGGPFSAVPWMAADLAEAERVSNDADGAVIGGYCGLAGSPR